MRLAIYGKYFKDDRFNEIQHFFDALKQSRFYFAVYRKYFDDCLRNGLNLDNDTPVFNNHAEFVESNFDFLISIGGDGTILNSLEVMQENLIPVIGINTGRLGFLAGVAAADGAKMLIDLDKGHFTFDKRTLLELAANKPLFGGVKYALNDFVLHKKDSSSMITIHTYINGEFLNSYWSDGLIISTPTGSTGYNLSCGGPILYPASQSLVITPIAPHNLNVRPIIISDQNVISFEIEGRSSSFLVTLDSRSESIDNSTQLAIKKANKELSLVRFNGENYLQTLREKLLWGHDNRNFRQ